MYVTSVDRLYWLDDVLILPLLTLSAFTPIAEARNAGVQHVEKDHWREGEKGKGRKRRKRHG